MRISTSQIYDAGSLNIQRNQSEIFKTQNQLSTGRRFLTAADDPVAAAQALVVTQSQSVTAQHVANQGNANSQLGLVESQLSSLTDLLQNVRERVVQAGNTILSNSDRQSLATELEARLSEMLGIANSDNGSGDFLFSGYRGATRPFAVSGGAAIAPASTPPIDYFGDDGERLLQVSSARQMAVSVAGSDVFMGARSGNGTFVAATGGNVGVSGNVGNTGEAVAAVDRDLNRPQWTAALANPLAGQPLEIRFLDVAGAMNYQIYDSVGGSTAPTPYVSGNAIPIVTAGGVNFGAEVVVSDGLAGPADLDKFTIQTSANKGSATVDAGSVLDPQKWALAVNNPLAGQPLEIRFAVVAGVTTYGVYDPVSAVTTGPLAFTPGQAIPLVTSVGVDFGAQVVVHGAPANDDTFTIAPSSNQSVFQTMQNLIGILRSNVGSTSYTSTQFTNDLGGQLANVDQALNNVSQVQATVGTRMRELESLGIASSDLAIQFSETLSDLQDLDYAKAISDYTRQQMQLEAAQKSFVQISGLSLFNYI